MFGYFKRIASRIFRRTIIAPEVVAWYGIQATAGKNPVGWVDPQPYLSLNEISQEGLIPLEGQQLAELQQYPELVALLESQGASQLSDRRVVI